MTQGPVQITSYITPLYSDCSESNTALSQATGSRTEMSPAGPEGG
jgi:hypothetical protein